MFARIFLVLHGGPRVKIDVALKRLGLPYLTVHQDTPNPKAKLKVIWNPVAGHGGWLPFYPGDKWVDLVGNDIGLGGDFSRAANEELYRFARAHRKRYSIPEWGVAVDQPELVRYICDFVKGKAAIELAAYFRPGRVEVGPGPKPNSKQAYRSCLTPLGLARSYAAICSRPRARSMALLGCAPVIAAAGSRRGRGSSSGSTSRRNASRGLVPRRC